MPQAFGTFGRVVTGEVTPLPGEIIPGGGSPYYPTTPAPPWDFAVLIFSIIIWVIGLFLFYEAVKTQKYFLSEEKDTSWWDEFWCLIISLLIVVLWICRTVLVMDPFFEDYRVWLDVFLFQPREYASGFLLASLLPTSIGLLKLLTVVVTPQRRVPEVWGGSLVKIIFSLLNAVASIVTLVKLLRP